MSEGDFLQHILRIGSTDLKQQEGYHIREILRRDFCPALNIQADFSVVVEAALRQNFVPVVDDRKNFIGLVRRKDILRYCYGQAEGRQQAKALAQPKE